MPCGGTASTRHLNWPFRGGVGELSYPSPSASRAAHVRVSILVSSALVQPSTSLRKSPGLMGMIRRGSVSPRMRTFASTKASGLPLVRRANHFPRAGRRGVRYRSTSSSTSCSDSPCACASCPIARTSSRSAPARDCWLAVSLRTTSFFTRTPCSVSTKATWSPGPTPRKSLIRRGSVHCPLAVSLENSTSGLPIR
jgi:hypothetical protein